MSITVFAEDSSRTSELTVNITGFDHEEGIVIAQIYRVSDTLWEFPHKEVSAAISNEKAVVNFENLKWGEYALFVFHDENSNGIVDHTWYRFPAEPMGFSNGFRISLLTPVPTFEKMKFDFKGGE